MDAWDAWHYAKKRDEGKQGWKAMVPMKIDFNFETGEKFTPDFIQKRVKEFEEMDAQKEAGELKKRQQKNVGKWSAKAMDPVRAMKKKMRDKFAAATRAKQSDKGQRPFQKSADPRTLSENKTKTK